MRPFFIIVLELGKENNTCLCTFQMKMESCCNVLNKHLVRLLFIINETINVFKQLKYKQLSFKTTLRNCDNLKLLK